MTRSVAVSRYLRWFWQKYCYSRKFPFHIIHHLLFFIFWSGSFVVQNEDHFRSWIICGPIWGVCGTGSFAFQDRDHLRSLPWIICRPEHARGVVELRYGRQKEQTGIYGNSVSSNHRAPPHWPNQWRSDDTYYHLYLQSPANGRKVR